MLNAAWCQLTTKLSHKNSWCVQSISHARDWRPAVLSYLSRLISFPLLHMYRTLQSSLKRFSLTVVFVQLMGMTFVAHFFTHIAALTIDPADVSVRAKQSYSTPMPFFDRTKQPHVIHDLHCYLCDVKVYVSWAAVINFNLHFLINR